MWKEVKAYKTVDGRIHKSMRAAVLHELQSGHAKFLENAPIDWADYVITEGPNVIEMLLPLCSDLDVTKLFCSGVFKDMLQDIVKPQSVLIIEKNKYIKHMETAINFCSGSCGNPEDIRKALEYKDKKGVADKHTVSLDRTVINYSECDHDMQVTGGQPGSFYAECTKCGHETVGD